MSVNSQFSTDYFLLFFFFVLLILYYYFIIRCGICCCSCCSLSSVFFVLVKCSRISIVASSFVDLDSRTYLFVWFYFGSFFSTSNQIHKLTRTHTHTHKNRLNFHLIANVFVCHSIRINRRFAAGSIHSFAFECVGFCNVSLSPFCLKLEFLRWFRSKITYHIALNRSIDSHQSKCWKKMEEKKDGWN